MNHNKTILPLIEETVKSVIADGAVHLFGSRSNDTAHAESDWDILILTEKHYPKSVKWQIHDKLFPLSIKFGTFINIVLVDKKSWSNNPAYYSLKSNIEQSTTGA